MPSNLSRFTNQSIERSAHRALDRTNALAMIACEDVAAIGATGQEVARSILLRGLERRAIEQVLPEVSDQLEYASNGITIAQVARAQRLAREL